MRIATCVSLLILGLLASGCQSLGRRAPSRGEASGRTSPPAADPILPPPGTGPSGGLIAGQVVDGYNRNPRAEIELITPADGDGAPVVRRVGTDDRGYFTILNVRPGQSYQLIARTQDGPLTFSGSTWVQPPNARVVIRLSEDSSSRPAAPAPGPSAPAIMAPNPVPRAPVIIERPTPIAPGAALDPARSPGGSPTPARPPVVTRPENIVDRGGGTPPRAVIPGPTPPRPNLVPPTREQPAAPSLAPAPPVGSETNSLAPTGMTPIPSCQLVGKQLVNFALAKVDGQPWEYRSDRRGRLVLLDFWGTWCGPCRHCSREILPQLQATYGRSGLEVIGIAYEKDRNFQDQVRKVLAARAADGINYTLLMGYGSDCPVKQQFGVEGLPTLVLIDENGQIIWRSVGLDEAGHETLKVIIRQKLGLQ